MPHTRFQITQLISHPEGDRHRLYGIDSNGRVFYYVDSTSICKEGWYAVVMDVIREVK